MGPQRRLRRGSARHRLYLNTRDPRQHPQSVLSPQAKNTNLTVPLSWSRSYMVLLFFKTPFAHTASPTTNPPPLALFPVSAPFFPPQTRSSANRRFSSNILISLRNADASSQLSHPWSLKQKRHPMTVWPRHSKRRRQQPWYASLVRSLHK